MQLSGGRLPKLLKRLVTDRRANFAVMTALSAPFAIALCAVAVDQGSLFTERRSAQALVDIAAITAAANLSKAETAVLLTLADNGLPAAEIDNAGMRRPTPAKPTVSVVQGRYSATAALGARFQAGQQPYNAVRVSLREIGTLYFGSALMAPPVIGTTAVASTSATAAFSVGSGLIEVDTTKSAILNAVLGGLLGTSLSLKVMDYEALAR
ncbi:MAG TPA: TadG family pilus assembly protein, partial [Mesorhizobium sp.]